MNDDKNTGRLLGIAIRSQPGVSMVPVDRVFVTKEDGLSGDDRGGSQRRAVTVLSMESWAEACEAVETSLPWTTRRANLLVEGLYLEHSTGHKLQIGEIKLEVTGETRPCDIMEAACSGLREALKSAWRGGITCQVVEAGEIQVGDKVHLIF